jgi:hypothetical protein
MRSTVPGLASAETMIISIAAVFGSARRRPKTYFPQQVWEMKIEEGGVQVVLPGMISTVQRSPQLVRPGCLCRRQG